MMFKAFPHRRFLLYVFITVMFWASGSASQVLFCHKRNPSQPSLLAEMIQPYRIFQSGFDHNPKFSLGPHKIISGPNQQEVV